MLCAHYAAVTTTWSWNRTTTATRTIPGQSSARTAERSGRYMYTGRRTSPLPPGWGSIRAQVLQRDPICRWGSLPEDHADPGLCMERSTDADHTGSPTNHDLSALRGLCTRHHAIRTGRQGAAGKAQRAFSRKRPPDEHPGFRRLDRTYDRNDVTPGSARP